MKEQGKEANNIVVAALDFQKTLLCPHGQVS